MVFTVTTAVGGRYGNKIYRAVRFPPLSFQCSPTETWQENAVFTFCTFLCFTCQSVWQAHQKVAKKYPYPSMGLNVLFI